MKLGLAVEMAVGLMKRYKLDKWTLELDTSNAVSGWCAKKGKSIGLSRVWIEVCTEKEVKDTILHEIAHALSKEWGHGEKWKEKAKELGAVPKAKVDRAIWLDVKEKINKTNKK